MSTPSSFTAISISQGSGGFNTSAHTFVASNIQISSSSSGGSSSSSSSSSFVYLKNTETTDVSESIVNGKRRVNVVFNNNAFPTNNIVMIGGHRIKLWGIGHQSYALPIWIDDNSTLASSSARINDKIYDVDFSGTNGAYCLTVNNMGRDANLNRYVKIEDVAVSTNEFGDIILVNPGGSPTIDTVVFWLGQTLRLVLVNNEWRIVISL